MTNKEKYKEEILNVAVCGDGVALSKVDDKIYNCEDIKCHDCKFSNNEFNCKDMRAKWAYEEYVYEPYISKSDMKILDLINDNCYIVRDSDGTLYCYSNKPKKCSSDWSIGNYRDTYCSLNLFNFHLPMVKWENEEPWQVKKLKQLKIKD